MCLEGSDRPSGRGIPYFEATGSLAGFGRSPTSSTTGTGEPLSRPHRSRGRGARHERPGRGGGALPGSCTTGCATTSCCPAAAGPMPAPDHRHPGHPIMRPRTCTSLVSGSAGSAVPWSTLRMAPPGAQRPAEPCGDPGHAGRIRLPDRAAVRLGGQAARQPATARLRQLRTTAATHRPVRRQGRKDASGDDRCRRT